MSTFDKNPTDFSAVCAREGGECTVERDNILFLDDGVESLAVTHLQLKCGNVIITPDPDNPEQALLYHTSCRRMADVVRQIFQTGLQAPESLAQGMSDMSLGEVQRHCVELPYDECKVKVEEFSF